MCDDCQGFGQAQKKVLILERGGDAPTTDTFSRIASIAREFIVGDRLKATTVIATGGSTNLYFGVCKLPNEDTFKKLGLDLSVELDEVKQELPLAQLPDDCYPPQSRLFRESAELLGYTTKKHLMLIDPAQCHSGYAYEAKWKAKRYLNEAIENGAVLIKKAEVERVIVENGQAVGVEYRHKKRFLSSKIVKVFGKKVVLGAGALATPKLLIDCGIKNIGNHGFFCKPGFMVCGTVPGLKGEDAFVGSFDIDLGNGVALGDGTMNASLFKLAMLSNLKIQKIFSHSTTLSAGILLNDTPGGEVRSDGSYFKKLSDEEYKKLSDAKEVAVKILENAGAIDIFTTNLVASIPGGVLRINEHLDQNMQTEIKDLYVCDHSLMNDVNITPTVALICMGKYLAKRLVASSQESSVVNESRVA